MNQKEFGMYAEATQLHLDTLVRAKKAEEMEKFWREKFQAEVRNTNDARRLADEAVAIIDAVRHAVSRHENFPVIQELLRRIILPWAKKDSTMA